MEPLSLSLSVVTGPGSGALGRGAGGAVLLERGANFTIRVVVAGALREGGWHKMCVRSGGGRHDRYVCVEATNVHWDDSGAAALVRARAAGAGEQSAAAVLVDRWGRAVARAAPLALWAVEPPSLSLGVVAGPGSGALGRGVGSPERVAVLVETRRHALLGLSLIHI